MRVNLLIILFTISYSLLGCENEGNNDSQLELKKACINAAIVGIELDIERHLTWLENRPIDTLEINDRLEVLKNDLNKYQNQLSNLDLYELSEKFELPESWIEEPCQINTQLRFNGQTKSGPFYHIAGIKDNDYDAIHPDTIYHVVMYLVYPRYYTFSDFYVYIHKFDVNFP